MMMVPYINLQMEVAAQQCKSTCPKGGCSSDPVNSVDIAAAFYIGSLENGSGSGKLMYSVADLECKEFKTCGITGDATTGTAKANIEILQDFLDMQTNLTAQACSVARSQKDHVMNRMNIPLIQGTLRYAYLRSKDKATEIDTAIGAAYAASIVPLVAGCSFQDAVIIHDNMETTATSTDFATVKEAFERHYACLGLTCKDIGGYWDRRSYFEGAAPCTFDVVKTESVPKKAIGWGVGVPLFLIAAGVLFCVCRRNSGKKSRNIDDFSDSSFDDDEDCSPII